MPRRPLSPRTRRAHARQRKSQWRQGVANSARDSQQADNFINRTIASPLTAPPLAPQPPLANEPIQSSLAVTAAVIEDVECERETKASPLTNLCHDNNNEDNILYHYNSDSDANDEWGMEEGNEGAESRVDEEMEEAETERKGSIKIRGHKGHEDEGYPYKESSQIRVDTEMGEAEREAKGNMEMGGSEGFLLDAGSQYYQEDATSQTSSAEEDDFIPLLDLASSLESFHASVEDEEEQERREIARAAIQAGVDEIDLTAVEGSEDDSSWAQPSREEEHPHEESLEGRADEEMEGAGAEAGIGAEGSIEIGAPGPSAITAVIRHLQARPLVSSAPPRVEEDAESERETEASPSTNRYDDDDDSNILYHYSSDDDADNDWRMEEGSEDREGGVDEEMEEAEMEAGGSMGIGAPERHAEEESPHEESGSEIDASMSDVDDEASVQAQLQRELRQSHESTAEAEEEDEVDYAAELARHLLSFHGCDDGAHQQAYDQHFADESRINNHYSLTDITHITGRLPGVIDSPGIMKSDSPIRRNPLDWPLAFEGLHSGSDGSHQESGDDEGDERIHVCLHSSEQQRRPTRA